MYGLNYKNIQQFEQDFYLGKYPNERYGQAFMNNFDLTEKQKEIAEKANLFYEEDTKVAARVAYKIWENPFLGD